VTAVEFDFQLDVGWGELISLPWTVACRPVRKGWSSASVGLFVFFWFCIICCCCYAIWSSNDDGISLSERAEMEAIPDDGTAAGKPGNPFATQEERDKLQPRPRRAGVFSGGGTWDRVTARVSNAFSSLGSGSKDVDELTVHYAGAGPQAFLQEGYAKRDGDGGASSYHDEL